GAKGQRGRHGAPSVPRPQLGEPAEPPFRPVPACPSSRRALAAPAVPTRRDVLREVAGTLQIVRREPIDAATMKVRPLRKTFRARATVGSAANAGLEDAEAHFVRRALAPEDVARRKPLHAHHRLA